MKKHKGEHGVEGGGSDERIHSVQPERDLEANWEVNLANKLEEYLLKICSGEITGTEEDGYVPTINFAEAALLLQGSIQVYSRKVEYLYNLVLHALEFLSNKRQQDQSEGTQLQPDESCSHAVSDDENDIFWSLDDIPVDVKNLLDSPTDKDTVLKHFVKPPANLVVLEGDSLDATGDGELESYLLATSDLCRDFILLDPCDAVAVNDFLGDDEGGKGKSRAHRGSSARKRFQSPRSGGTARRSSLGKNQDANINQSPGVSCSFNANNINISPPVCDSFKAAPYEFDMGDRFPGPMDFNDFDSDSDGNDDPWKPLIPHEIGNLKVKPFHKVKGFKTNWINSTKGMSITALFPLARMQGTTSPELTEIWDVVQGTFERQKKSQADPPLYEKLRQQLTGTSERYQPSDAFANNDEENEDNEFYGGVPDFGEPDRDIPDPTFMDEDVLPNSNKKNDAHFDSNDAYENGDPSSQASLEDLCRSHLDALLASIAETEKQTELATRVSSWKQKIEQQLEDLDSRPPFDIHHYGETIFDRLSVGADDENTMSFTDVVKGQEKHDVARTFSALLQLVNNGEVDLDKMGAAGGSVCHTNVMPFKVRHLRHGSRKIERQFKFVKKKVKSPIGKNSSKGGRQKRMRDDDKSLDLRSSPGNGSSAVSSQSNCKFSESKKSKKSRFVKPVDLHSAG